MKTWNILGQVFQNWICNLCILKTQINMRRELKETPVGRQHCARQLEHLTSWQAFPGGYVYGLVKIQQVIINEDSCSHIKLISKIRGPEVETQSCKRTD